MDIKGVRWADLHSLETNNKGFEDLDDSVAIEQIEDGELDC